MKLIKSKGYLVYFDGEPVAELSYLDSANEKITSFCMSFGDAVTDINNLKVKRDYQITLLEDIDASAAITMPSSKYVSLLTIDGKGYELGFIKNISFQFVKNIITYIYKQLALLSREEGVCFKNWVFVKKQVLFALFW